MKNIMNIEYENSEDIQLKDPDYTVGKESSLQAFEKLEEGVKSALESYSNVHRGTGQYSVITTALFERARIILLDYLGLDQESYQVVFCSAYGSELLRKQLHVEDYEMISSHETGLPLGLRVLAIKKSVLSRGVPFQTGGSVAKMVSPHFVIWADVPQKLEAGTPSIINAITLAIAIELQRKYGSDCFRSDDEAMLSIAEIFDQDDVSGYTGLKLEAELEKMLVGRDLNIPTREGEKPYINFDNAASTPTFLPVWDVVKKVWRLPYTRHREIISEVRKIVADFLGANPETYDTLFTYNTTEAINMVARSIKSDFTDDSEFVILNTILEHNSNELPWRYIPGASLIRLSIDKYGFVNPDELELILRRYNLEYAYGKKRIRIVAISGASNVLGTFNDIKTISTIAHKYGARILVDGAQLVAHCAVIIDQWDIDYFAFSGHKVYAPFGTGVLLVRKELMHFAFPELQKISESGEENITGIAALGKSITLLQRVGMDMIEEKEKMLVSRLLKGLSAIKGIEVFGITDPDSANFARRGGIVSFRVKKVPHHIVARELAEQGGIGIRFGCFCTHLLIKHLLKVPPALQFIQNVVLTLVPRLSNIIPGLVRISFHFENEMIEVEQLITVLKKIVDGTNSKKQDDPSFHFETDVKEKIKEFSEARLQKVYSQIRISHTQDRKVTRSI